MSWLKVSPQAVEVQVRVVPRASRNEVAGLVGDALKLRLRAPPVEGKANLALTEFLADQLGVRRRDIALISGETGRLKRVRISGVNEEQVRRALGV